MSLILPSIRRLTSDPIEIKVLEMLYKKEPLRFSEILNSLMEIETFQKEYARNSLAVILTRKLKRLEKDALVRKTVEGHKKVYYSLTRNSKIFLDKETEWLLEPFYKSLGIMRNDETTESNLRVYLTALPHVILEILADLYRDGPISQEMLKHVNHALKEYISNPLESLVRELNVRREEGEDLDEIFNKIMHDLKP